MEKYITDSIYHNKTWERTMEELAEKRIYRRLAAVIPREDYLLIEEELIWRKNGSTVGLLREYAFYWN